MQEMNRPISEGRINRENVTGFVGKGVYVLTISEPVKNIPPYFPMEELSPWEKLAFGATAVVITPLVLTALTGIAVIGLAHTLWKRLVRHRKANHEEESGITTKVISLLMPSSAPMIALAAAIDSLLFDD